MNNKGWIKIVEAFVAVILVGAVLLIVLNSSRNLPDNESEKIYGFESSLLREIQLDKGMREEVIQSGEITQLSAFPPLTQTKIQSSIASYLECEARICLISNICEPLNNPNKNLYVKSIVISANLETYNPKQVKLYCWLKD